MRTLRTHPVNPVAWTPPWADLGQVAGRPVEAGAVVVVALSVALAAAWLALAVRAAPGTPTPGAPVPYLTITASPRRRDRPLAHPELTLAPGWVLLGLLGIDAALSDPWHPVVTPVAVATATVVALGGLLLIASVLAPPDRLALVWQLERAGWIVGVGGWITYAAGVGFTSPLVLILALTFLAVGAYRVVALGRTRDHIREVRHGADR